MQYNSNINYNSPNYSYSGTLIIYAPSLVSPIILNSIAILFNDLGEDYSNYTTIAVVSMDVNPSGDISIQVLDEDVSALVSVQSIAITNNSEISIIA